jgi:hypothetical protein
MNATATKKFAFAALAAPVLTAVAVGLAGAASAESSSGSALDVIAQFTDEGHEVVINKTGNGPLNQCSIITTRQDRHEHHGGPQSDAFNTVYIDALCPTS